MKKLVLFLSLLISFSSFGQRVYQLPFDTVKVKTDLKVPGTLTVKSITGLTNSANPASDLTTIEAWGDSHTAGAGETPYTTTLASLSGLVVNNNGIGGETSTQIKTRFDASSSAKKARPTIIWMGYNDYATDNNYTGVKANIAAMVASLGHSSYLIIGEVMSTNGGFDAGAFGWLNKMQFNRELAATYGHRFFDVHSFLMSKYDPTNATDLENYLKDQEPSTLRTDPQHFTSAANALIGAEIYRRLKDIGIGSTTLNREQLNSPVLSPVYVGGVNKAPGRFSYLEADKISIRQDGALMQEGLPVYKHFRRSNFLGHNSGLAVRTGTGTSNLDNVVIGDNNFSQGTGNSNIILGTNTGNNLTTGSNNFVVGNAVDAGSAGSSNEINIMNVIRGSGANTTGNTIPTSARVGIKISNLTSTLTVGGTLGLPILSGRTLAYTLGESDHTVNFTGATTVNATLPTAVGCNGRIYVIKNSGTGVITVVCNGAQTIDGAATYVLDTQYEFVTVQSNNANWVVIGN